MRPTAVALLTAALLAVGHVLGVLTDRPLLRYAEVLVVLLLLAYVLLARLPSPGWALPVALAVPAVDAVRTMPVTEPATSGWTVYRDSPVEVDGWHTFTEGLAATWAGTAFAVVLLLWLAARGGEQARRPVPAVRRRLALAGGALAVTLVVGYALVRVVQVWRVLVDARDMYDNSDPGEAATAAGLAVVAVVAPLLLALASLVLTVALARRALWLAAGGAALLAAVALPLLDAALTATPLPIAAYDGALFGRFAITPTLSMPAPVPALTAAVKLTAYALVVVGLVRAAGPPAQPVRQS
ncbi:hypothetical protein [Micromonospora okii]|uniref:hypothetical protein n=1 Tax=Micromonospora okii TaxID=1182970 RepID=UPI001E31EF7B|nr:hypothetical protein [Micromonospora okii]